MLREKARQVDPDDENVRAVAVRMIELMHEADGVGLAVLGALYKNATLAQHHETTALAIDNGARQMSAGTQ